MRLCSLPIPALSVPRPTRLFCWHRARELSGSGRQWPAWPVLWCVLLLAAGACLGQETFSHDGVLARHADSLRENGSREEAVHAYWRLLAEYPHHYRAWYELARMAHDAQQWGRAVCLTRKALVHNPGWPDAEQLMARACEEAGMLDSAVGHLESYLPHAPSGERSTVERRLSSLRRRASRETGVQSIPAMVEDSIPPAPSRTPAIDSLFRQAVSQYEARDYEASLQTVRAVISRQSDHGGAYYYGGLIRQRWGQTRLAKVNFVKGLRYPELGYNAHFYLGKIYGGEQEYELAIRHLRRYLARTTYKAGRDEATSLIRRYQAALGDTLVALVDGGEGTPEGVSSVHPAQCLAPLPGLEPYLQARVGDTAGAAMPAVAEAFRLLREGRYRDAGGLMEEWLIGGTDTTGTPLLLYNLGVCHVREGRFEEARNRLREFAVRAPTHALARQASFLEGVSAVASGDFEYGETALRRLAMGAREAWAWKALECVGDAYEGMGRHGRAADFYRKAADNAPSERERRLIHYKLGLSKLHEGRLRGASTTFRRLVGETTRNEALRCPESLLRLADIAFSKGAYAEARESYAEAYARYPDHIEAPWALYQMAAIDTRLGERTRAAEMCRDLIDTFPGDYWARQAAWRWPAAR